jgi:hypothetical protein
MFTHRSGSNLRVLSSLRFAWISACQTPADILAALALCAAITAATPGYSEGAGAAAPDSRADHPNAQDLAHGAIRPDDRADISVTETVLPDKKTYIWAEISYHKQTCSENSPGTWKVNTAPKYGVTATGLVSGYLSNGDCPGIRFTGRAIYYTWTKTKVKPTPKKDKFVATWSAPGNPKVPAFTFNLNLK